MSASTIRESPTRGAGPQRPTSCPSLAGGAYGEPPPASPPSCPGDLHLDQVIAAAAPGTPQARSHGTDIHDHVSGEEIAGHRPDRARFERG